MIKNNSVQYYVEGEDERKFISVLKTDMRLILPGKVDRLNVIEQKITDARLRTLQQKTTVILIFDTDTGQTATLYENIKKLEASTRVAQVITIPQIMNLEDELVRSCNIRDVNALLGSKTLGDFKADLIKVSNLKDKLEQHGFQFHQLWSKKPLAPYNHIQNGADKIRLL